MSDNIVTLELVDVGDDYRVDIDAMLEANKGAFRSLAMVGLGPDGELIVCTSGGAADAHFLFARGAAALVRGMGDSLGGTE